MDNIFDLLLNSQTILNDFCQKQPPTSHKNIILKYINVCIIVDLLMNIPSDQPAKNDSTYFDLF